MIIGEVGTNYVMIHIPRTHDEMRAGIYTHSSGLLIKKLEGAHEAAGHNVQNGTVVGVGELHYDKENPSNMKWKTTNELLPGDQVVFYYNADCWETGEFLVDGQDVYFFIRYHNIYFAVRDGKIIPVNGYNLIEPVDENIFDDKHDVFDPTWSGVMGLTNFFDSVNKGISLDGEPPKITLLKKQSKRYGCVRHIGHPVEEHSMTDFSDEVPRFNGTKHVGYGLKVNDFVILEKWAAKPIMYATQNFVGNYFTAHRLGIVAVIEDVSRIKLN